MYGSPPFSLTINSAALVAGTIGPTVYLVAGGAGTAYRIVGFNFALSTAVPAATLVLGLITDNVNTYQIRFGLGGGSRMYNDVLPAPGLQSAVNSPLSYTIVSSAAGGTVLITILYFIDGVT